MSEATTSPQAYPANIDEDGNVPESRVKDAESALAIFNRLEEGDRPASYNRACIEALLNGEPPYDDEAAQDAGIDCNVNWLSAKGRLDSALTPYNDAVSMVDTLVYIETDYGNENEKEEWSQIISEEYDYLNRTIWDSFDANWALLSRFAVSQGVGIAFFPNEHDWRWNVSKLGDFFVERPTGVTTDDVEIAIQRREYTPAEVYSYIKDSETAERVGWNVEATKKAIAEACVDNVRTYWQWEKIEEDLKNNSFYYTFGKGYRVNLLNVLVKEFDETVSHYIVPENRFKEGQLEFLYEKRGRYKAMSEYLVLFTHDVGNGDIHSIRGLGWQTFPQEQVLNQLRCRTVDATNVSMSLLLQPKDANDLQSLQTLSFGGVTILPPGVEYVERNVPNIANNALPILNNMETQIANNTGSYVTNVVNPTNVERTAEEIQHNTIKETRMTMSSMNQFYRACKKLHTTQVMRLAARHYPQDYPGGKERWEFVRRCKARGVPMEAIESIKNVEPVRSIGAGSPAARMMAMQQLWGLSPAFDEQGRQNCLRDMVASITGSYEKVARYVPKIKNSRPPIDKKMAQLENMAFMNGQILEVLPNELHAVHAKEHMVFVSNLLQALAPKNGSQPLTEMQVFPQLQVAIPHTRQHIDFLSKDMSQVNVFTELNKAQAQFENILKQMKASVEKEVQKQQQQALQAAQMQAQAGGQQLTPEQQIKAQEAEFQMQIETAKTEQDMRLKEAETEQRMQLREAEAKQKSVLRDVDTAQKVQQQTQKLQQP